MIFSGPVDQSMSLIRRRKVKVCVVGLGTIGLPLATHLAQARFSVLGLDIDAERIAQIAKGKVRFEYQAMLRKVIGNGKLQATLNAEAAIATADAVFVCVPTGLTSDNSLDSRNLLAATSTIARYLRKGVLIIVESTVGIGTTRDMAEELERKTGLKVGRDFGIAHCPERYNPALPSETFPAIVYKSRRVKREEYTIDRISRIVGGIDRKSSSLAVEIYRQFINAPVNEVSSLETAEATKIFENVFRDVNIGLVNELAKVLPTLGLDVYEVIEAAKTKPYAFLPHYPGPGVGGECIPVVPWFLINQAEANGQEAKLMRTAREINDSMSQYVVDALEHELSQVGRNLSESRITLLGLAYKKNINDARLSPALKLVEILKPRGASVIVCDPLMENYSKSHELSPLRDCFKGADAAVLVTDHDVFANLDFRRIVGEMRSPIIIDSRNFYDGEKLVSLGFQYRCIGKAKHW